MRSVVFIYLLFTLTFSSFAETQERKTPEQEAAGQAEKMQKELNLNSEQTEAVYRIQLKYAKQREASNSRSEALERAKNKETDLKEVLHSDQYERLQNKKFDRNITAPQNSPLRDNSLPNRVNSSREDNQIRRSSSQGVSEPNQLRTTEQSKRVQPSRSAEQIKRAIPSRAGNQRTQPSKSIEPSNRIQPSRSIEPSNRVQPSRVNPNQTNSQPNRIEPNRSSVNGSNENRRNPDNQGSRSR